MEYCGKLFPFVHEIVGLFGNIRNILEISCKFLLNFECSISEIHEIVVNFLKIVKFLKVPCAVF